MRISRLVTAAEIARRNQEDLTNLSYQTRVQIYTAHKRLLPMGFDTWAHICPELPRDERLLAWQRSGVEKSIQYCPFCGQHLGGKMPIEQPSESEATVAKLARSWLGSDAKPLIHWLRASVKGRFKIARQSGPLLTHLLTTLQTIANRRCQLADSQWSSADREARDVFVIERALFAIRERLKLEAKSQFCEAQLGFVYAIADGAGIKLGWSSKHPLIGRLSSLQTGSAKALALVGTFLGCVQDERHLHGLFSKYWIRGEWFKDTPEIRSYFQTHPSRVKISRPKPINFLFSPQAL